MEKGKGSWRRDPGSQGGGEQGALGQRGMPAGVEACPHLNKETAVGQAFLLAHLGHLCCCLTLVPEALRKGHQQPQSIPLWRVSSMPFPSTQLMVLPTCLSAASGLCCFSGQYVTSTSLGPPRAPAETFCCQETCWAPAPALQVAQSTAGSQIPSTAGKLAESA